MFKYVLKRLLLMIFTFLIIVTMCFFLVKLLPDTPPEQFGKDYQVILTRRKLLGYDKPLIEQYFIFLTKTLIGGNWGYSEVMYKDRLVWDIFLEKLPLFDMDGNAI